MVIRPATVLDAAEIARIQVDTWRSTYQGIVPETRLQNMRYDRQSEKTKAFLEGDRPETFAFVAEENENLVGFVFSGPENSGDPKYRGEIYALYVLAGHQRRGIGRRLVAAATGRLREMGCSSLLVWVLSKNPSRSFYEALGGKAIRTGTISIDGQDIEETAYGWEDISAIV